MSVDSLLDGIGQALAEARLRINKTQDEIGEIVLASYKSISAYEVGRRLPDLKTLFNLINFFDFPWLYMKIQQIVTGGVFSTVKLDGDGVDLHRASVKQKLAEELREALGEVEKLDLINLPRAATQEQRDTVKASIEQIVDARVAIDHFLAVICQEYEVSPKEIFAEHRAKLKRKGYTKG